MEIIHFTLDGKPVEANAGDTILQAAAENGVEIPTLCNDPRLRPYAGCRLCLVEVEKARGPLPACATAATEGMAVSTHSDTLRSLRRMCLELLLSDHYGDCVAPCRLACPAGVDVQGFVALVADGRHLEAVKLIKETNPLPAICGRVCPRFCEQKCRRSIVDEPVAINALKRFVADFELTQGAVPPERKPSTGRRVAVVGGGPAGLSAAFFLAKDGHEVSLFDANPELGGMLRYGIPEYRLPKDLLDREIATITEMCAETRCDSALGRDFTIDSLKNAGFEAVFLAVGSQSSQKLGVEGEVLEGVTHGVSFLRDAARGVKVPVGRRVIVVGGGNTAMDAARAAARLGAEEVTVVYRRSRDEMPANHEEVEQAEEEGVRLQFLAAPTRILGIAGRIEAMECARMALGEPDSSGRRRPKPLAGSEFLIPADMVIAAIGQTLDASLLEAECGALIGKKGALTADPLTQETAIAGVFAGGDCETGPDTVVRAVGAGRRAAVSIGMFLRGETVLPEQKPYNCSKGELNEIDPAEYADVEKSPRAKQKVLDPKIRINSFDEIESGLDDEAAIKEATRCLSCGCREVYECKLRGYATEYEADGTRFGGDRHIYPVYTDHPNFVRDPSKCVLCGSCLRMCAEVQGIGALSFVRRGYNTVIQPSFGQPLQKTLCDSCGQCVSACPTGALSLQVYLPKPGPWQLDKARTVCPNCGVGCNLEIGSHEGKIVRGASWAGSPVNEGNLCSAGAFDYASFYSEERARVPMIKKNGRLAPAEWDEAIAEAGDALRRIRDEQGGDRLAVLASAKLTNEENYLAQKIARIGLETNNIAGISLSPANNALLASFGRDASTCSFDDIDRADLIFIYGFDPVSKFPIISLKIRRASGKGARLIIANNRPTRLDSLADGVMKMPARVSVDVLKSMINYILRYNLYARDLVDARTMNLDYLERIVEDHPLERRGDALWVKPNRIVEMTHLYVRAHNPVILVRADSVTNAELTWLSNLALLTGNVGRKHSGILLLRDEANRQGQIDMGVSPDMLPGQQSLDNLIARKRLESAWKKTIPRNRGKSASEIIDAARSGEIKGLLILSGGDDLHNNALFAGDAYTAVISPLASGNAARADVLLPGSVYAETEGTVTNSERRVQKLNRAASPISGMKTWEILTRISARLGCPLPHTSPEDVFAEIAQTAPIYSGLDYDLISDSGMQWPVGRDGQGTATLYEDEFDHEDGIARFGPPQVVRHIFPAQRVFAARRTRD
jgi:formate dehydrogenase major subunit